MFHFLWLLFQVNLSENKPSRFKIASIVEENAGVSESLAYYPLAGDAISTLHCTGQCAKLKKPAQLKEKSVDNDLMHEKSQITR